MQPCCDKARPAQAEGESTPGKLTARSWRSTGPSSPLKQRPRGARYGAAEESLAQAVWRGGRVRERHGKRFHVAGTSDQYWLGKRQLVQRRLRGCVSGACAVDLVNSLWPELGVFFADHFDGNGRQWRAGACNCLANACNGQASQHQGQSRSV